MSLQTSDIMEIMKVRKYGYKWHNSTKQPQFLKVIVSWSA